MELLEGRPLDVVLDTEGRLPPERVRKIALQILKSLQEAHSKGIIHRDLKPANVFLADLAGETDYVKVLDFGIAKTLDDSQDTSLTATGQVMCSPHYVAPERIKDHLTVAASDVYSLGVMMVELLEGKPPYEADSPMMLAVKHLSAEPVPLGESTRAAPFAGVVQRACAKPLDERYSTALEMMEALSSAQTTAVTPLPPVDTNTSAPASGTTEALPAHQARSVTDVLEPDLAPQRSQKGLMVGVLLLFVLLGGVAAKFIISGLPVDAPSAPETGVANAVPPTTPEPVVEQEPEPEPPAPVLDVAGTVRTARTLVGAAKTTAEAGALLAAGSAVTGEEIAAVIEPEVEEEPQRNRDRDRDREREREREAAEEEAQAAQAAEAAAREAAATEEAEREAAAREAERAREAEEAREAEAEAAAAAAAAEEEERGGRRNIRTNVAPRQ